MSTKSILITIFSFAVIAPVAFVATSSKVQTSTTVERQEFDTVVFAQKEKDDKQDERISKLESSSSSKVDFTDLGKEAVDRLPKTSSSSTATNKTMSTPTTTPNQTVTTPQEPIIETPKKYAYRTEMLAGVGYNNGMARQKEMQCKFKCWSTIVETDTATGLVKAFYMTFENEQELIKLFSYPVKYTKVEI